MALVSLPPIIMLLLTLAFERMHHLYGLTLIFLNLNMSVVYTLGYELLSELAFPVCKNLL